MRKWSAWLRRNEHRIAAGEERRTARVGHTEPLRLRCGAAWNDLGNPERERVAWAVDTKREDLVELLADPLAFAWSGPEARRELSMQLGVGDVPHFELSDRFIPSWRAAVEDRQLGDDAATEVLRVGLLYEQRRYEQEASGNKLRKAPLTKPPDWNGIIDRVCRRRCAN